MDEGRPPGGRAVRAWLRALARVLGDRDFTEHFLDTTPVSSPGASAPASATEVSGLDPGGPAGPGTGVVVRVDSPVRSAARPLRVPFGAALSGWIWLSECSTSTSTCSGKMRNAT